MKTTTNTKIAIGFTIAMIAAISIFIVIAITQAAQSQEETQADLESGQASAIRGDTHRLDDAPGSTVTVVEFLDFECESCAAVFPAMEDAREEFAGEVTFAVRYFPLPGHFNSTNAALSVEAAAQQGAFEEMYKRMFETQLDWGEQRESRAPLFREYAESLGLDMAQYDADVAEPATAARVKSDFADGQALGVSGTPTIFINDKVLELRSLEDVRAAIAQELAK